MIHVFFIWSKKLCPDTRCHLGCFVLGAIFPKPNVGVRVPCVGVFFRPFCCRRFAWRKTSKRWTGGTECVLFWKIHSLESTLAKITGFPGFVFHLLAAVWKNGVRSILWILKVPWFVLGCCPLSSIFGRFSFRCHVSFKEGTLKNNIPNKKGTLFLTKWCWNSNKAPRSWLSYFFGKWTLEYAGMIDHHWLFGEGITQNTVSWPCTVYT